MKRSVFVENIEEICICERSEYNEEICLPDLNRIAFVEKLGSFPKHLVIFLLNPPPNLFKFIYQFI